MDFFFISDHLSSPFQSTLSLFSRPMNSFIQRFISLTMTFLFTIIQAIAIIIVIQPTPSPSFNRVVRIVWIYVTFKAFGSIYRLPLRLNFFTFLDINTF
ncbi:hypothetical protein BY996DRAFT_7230997 [Phakopsora pachyrhizi]|nr:hypothetical protein BY996DRAFT_7230997 [Phakopsora pachyrhizi]